ncbi:hypothetical protein M427DRAFT_263273 [Gonapodya prolifera JEL478]|uniref:ARM repeat-containing protein n=1 Tax=Gonapodya prolifera (strain JEL478) TaxID=1344416 RepID=A0A139AKY5_GONPJ|nr:hypothetical protein M427DRAFT_263273 [Gonapodya prolifera JEL478]|eukprot:KXS17085.1 hypothetical protein M427DRAFT_263273 [Gonapodya prolifera JEL478]
MIKLFAKVATVVGANFEQFNSEHHFLDTLDSILQNTRSSTLKEGIIVAIENLGSTVQGLLLLDHQKSLLSTFLGLYRSSNGEDRVMCLRTVSTLIASDEPPNPSISALSSKTFDSLGGRPNALKDLLPLARSSFEETRIASYAVLKSVAGNEWGLVKVRDTPGIIEFLLDRSTDHSIIGKEWKYSIVQSRHLHPSAPTVFGPHTLQRLDRFNSEGPFFAGAEAAVAMEAGR